MDVRLIVFNVLFVWIGVYAICLGVSFLYEAVTLAKDFGRCSSKERMEVVEKRNSLKNIFNGSLNLFSVIAFAYVLYKLICNIDLLIGV